VEPLHGEAAAPEHIVLPGADLLFWPRVDLGTSAQELFDDLQRHVAWREEDIVLFGRRYRQPRLLAWYGDPEATYRYSGRQHLPLAWTDTLTALRERLQRVVGAQFNSVLANLYRDERDSMGLHADDERELGPRPVIASLSLGETRRFRLRHRHRKDLKSHSLHLPSGSLLVMRGDTQRHWKHEVPKERRACGPRINLTFRYVYAQ
jgi:alkylated DNA repair dioxygenase AlkB